MTEIRIVPTADEYAEGFHQCLDSVARERRHLAFLEAPPLDAVRGFMRGLAAGAGIQVLAIDETNAVVGWCDIIPNSREGFRHCGQLGMGVLARVRGAGIGRRLAVAAIDRAKARGLERVELEVFESNDRAVALYRALGFSVEGVKRRARKLDGAYYDVLAMALIDDSLS